MKDESGKWRKVERGKEKKKKEVGKMKEDVVAFLLIFVDRLCTYLFMLAVRALLVGGVVGVVERLALSSGAFSFQKCFQSLFVVYTL